MSVAEVVSARFGADLLERLDDVRGDLSRGAWLLSAAEAALSAGQSPALVSASPAGVPSPGVVCMTPKCMQRDTAKYGLRELPLCPACLAALFGETYRRRGAAVPKLATAS
jgi:hypothetical protein